MKAFLFLAFLLGSAVSNSDEEGAQEKFDFMVTKAKSSSNSLIDGLTKSEFKNHVANGPRPYGVLLFLTVLGNESSCKICGQVHTAAAELAKSLQAVRQDDKAVFVVEIDYSSSSSIISELGLDRVPQVLFVPRSKSSRSVALSDLIDSVGQKNSYALITGYKTENFLEFINKVGNLDIDLTRPVSTVEVLIFFVVIFFLLFVVFMSWNVIDSLRRKMLLYAVVGVCFYCFCIGGGMYSIIRNTPWHGGSKSNPEYINKSGRNQFTLEGYLMGIANFVGGLGIFLYVMSNKAGVSTGEEKNPPSGLFSWVPNIVAAGLFAFGYYSVVSVYNLKSPHYRMGFVGMTG